MLVLDRKNDQSIQIGEDIVITVRRAYNGKVKVCIDAPKHVKILRKELQDNATTDNRE